MTTTETKHAGFTALPAGWYNYYAEADERDRRKVFRSPCPGIIQLDTVETDDYGDSKILYSEYHSADVDHGYLDKASESDNYLGTFYGEEFWEEFGTLAPNETAVSE